MQEKPIIKIKKPIAKKSVKNRMRLNSKGKEELKRIRETIGEINGTIFNIWPDTRNKDSYIDINLKFNERIKHDLKLEKT